MLRSSSGATKFRLPVYPKWGKDGSLDAVGQHWKKRSKLVRISRTHLDWLFDARVLVACGFIRRQNVCLNEARGVLIRPGRGDDGREFRYTFSPPN